MIPTPLVPPLRRAGTVRRAPGRVALVVGVLLVVLGLTAGVVWAGALSPFGFRRFQLVDADRRVEFKQAGSWVVYLERPDEVEGGPVPVLEVSVVRTEDGVSVPVTTLQPRSDDPFAYETPWHRGRAVARFDIAEPGTYRLLVTPSGSRLNLQDGIALGREVGRGWLGSLWAGLAFVVVPVVVGLVLVVVSMVRGRRARRAVEPPAPSELAPAA